MTAEISTRQGEKLMISHDKDSKTSVSAKSIMGSGEKTSYTLYYFNIRGRAEPIRMLFELAGVKYTDRRVSYMEWPAMKQTMPMGQLPVLEVSGPGMKAPLQIAQTHTILRFLSKEFGLDGRTSLGCAKVDMIVETTREGIQPITLIFNEKDEEKKKEVLTKYGEELLPKLLNFLTRNLSEEWFLDQISEADVYVYVSFDNMSMFVPDFLDDKQYWKLREWRSRFEGHPKISEWLATRPVTPY